ncbi:hypothetical protein [Amycolatopsis sp. BJA-103]|uniref:hypothetical protein n=1 Tax=unclassified Amycolatopsis TaxID=2618356 RepID=UPI000C75B158|nr:hypothetical protein [Amycolatopsis sp. BJA-103]AUI60814.1 hypothetical protein BKN51_23265 [Amycolatopsis sp. BJA-103]PNE21903.1 hypothetical protein B1H26_09220 [Amycolatopsis sp. BJA-103]
MIIRKLVIGTIAAAALLTAVAVPATAAEVQPSTLTTTTSSTKIDAGKTVTISGKLKKADATPIAGAEVGISFCFNGFCGEAQAKPVTDAAGAYSATLTPIRTGNYHADFFSTDAAVANSQADTPKIVVLHPAKITSFAAGRGAAKAVTGSGTIDFPGQYTANPIPVELQYFSFSTYRWTTAATVDATWNGTTWAYAASAEHRKPGVWRAFYAGTPEMFHAAASDLVFVL